MSENRADVSASGVDQEGSTARSRTRAARDASVRVVHPVIGTLVPNVLMVLYPELATGFDEFVTPTMRGLARVRGGTLDILAMDARHPGHGDGGRFLAACMREYAAVRVYEIMNPDLDAMLARRGFVPFTETEGGETCTGREWRPDAVELVVDRSWSTPNPSQVTP